MNTRGTYFRPPLQVGGPNPRDNVCVLNASTSFQRAALNTQLNMDGPQDVMHLDQRARPAPPARAAPA